MKLTKNVLLAVLIVFIAIQFIQPARNQSGQASPAAITAIYTVPDTVQSLLQRACYDCHSNNTTYPWYTYIQPVGWFMQHHVNEGRRELNFSEFGSYTARKQANKLRSIAGSLKDGSMPISSYLLMHSNAKLSQQQKALLIDWVTETQDSISNKKL